MPGYIINVEERQIAKVLRNERQSTKIKTIRMMVKLLRVSQKEKDGEIIYLKWGEKITYHSIPREKEY